MSLQLFEEEVISTFSKPRVSSGHKMATRPMTVCGGRYKENAGIGNMEGSFTFKIQDTAFYK